MTCSNPRPMPAHWVVTKTELVVELTLADLLELIRNDWAVLDDEGAERNTPQIQSAELWIDSCRRVKAIRVSLTETVRAWGDHFVFTTTTYRMSIYVAQLLSMVDAHMDDPQLTAVSIRTVNGVNHAVRVTIVEVTHPPAEDQEAA